MLKTILIILLLLLLCMLIVGSNRTTRETFASSDEKFIYKNKGLYDDFYTNVYDELVHNEQKNKFEVGEIAKYVDTGKALDIGSGTGHHVNLLTKFKHSFGL